MPLYTTEAIILRTYKLGEADRIVVFLTRDRGKRRGVAQGARRMRSRFGGALEPLTRAEVTYFEKESRELVSLNYAEPLNSPLWSARGDALGHTGYFAELLDECALEGDADERLYRLGSSVIDAIGAGTPVEPLARYFEYWLLRLQGVYPSELTCSVCGRPLGRESSMAAVVGARRPGLPLRAVRGRRRVEGHRAVGRGGRVPPGVGNRRPGEARRAAGVGPGVARTGGGASLADRGAPGEGPEVRPRPEGTPRAFVDASRATQLP